MRNRVLDFLPDLSDDYPLSTEQVQQYRERGHVLLPNLISQAEIDAYRPHIVEAVEEHQDHNLLTEKLMNAERNKWIYIDNLWKLDAVTGRFILASRFAKIAAELLDVDAVRLYRNQVIFKKPGAVRTPWHQDGIFFPMDAKRTVTLWLHLVDVTPDMAMMIFADRTHFEGRPLGNTSQDEDEMSQFAQSLFEQGYPLNACRYYAAGDAEFIDGWNMHCTTDNNSDRTRESLVAVYYPDGARIGQPKELAADAPILEKMAENSRRQTRITCFPGLQPGDLAVTPMNPLVYSRQQD
ncbi:phytanoyl-CoA dioxygenase family protein [Moorena sp. SIO4E2]|uniref:phytanoyl-CoA dioxygenase family protein n=1 Tax=Moorena sp. SIO4E2 TaxID=2607826 RepID=UPI00257FB9A5|nr:phytanoyl-CoA dioxygenase family protein [Moorena sp. SIO4E2]